MLNGCIIREETEKDYSITENLTREAFWNVYRPGALEHYVLHCFRNDSAFIPELSLVMEKEGQIIGHIMFAKAFIKTDSGTNLPILTFGPISIAPAFKRQGYGKTLLDYALNKASWGGAAAMTGNILFYGKCGFDYAYKFGIRYHAEPDKEKVPYFLAKELIPNYLDGIKGVFKEPECYFVDEKEAEEFDKQFPYKEKLTLSGQLV